MPVVKVTVSEVKVEDQLATDKPVIVKFTEGRVTLIQRMLAEEVLLTLKLKLVAVSRVTLVGLTLALQELITARDSRWELRNKTKIIVIAKRKRSLEYSLGINLRITPLGKYGVRKLIRIGCYENR